ncbi:hypothetical protein ATCC90586_007360 [Pythium insidiosum]|nr:hypothetical protein ATCC90586_007360 [Pythium insidiosum]
MELCGPHKKRVKTDSAAAAASPPSPEAETTDIPRLLSPSPTSPPANPNGVRQGQGQGQGGFRGKCLYQSRKCENERALKRNGQPHNLCEEHRAKQNQHQRKFDAKKFSRRRRNGEDGVDDATHGDDGSQSSRGSGQPEAYLPTASSPSATLRESDLPDGPIALPNTPTQFPSGATGRPNRRCAPMAMRRDVRLRHELGLMRYRGRDTLYTDIVGQPERPRAPFQPPQREMAPLEGPSERSRHLSTLRPPPLQLPHHHNSRPYSATEAYFPSSGYSTTELLAARALVPPTEVHRQPFNGSASSPAEPHVAPSRLPSLRTLPLSSAMTPPESRGLYSP